MKPLNKQLVPLSVSIIFVLLCGVQLHAQELVKDITASDADEGDRFGSSSAIDGDTSVIGARLKDVGAVGAAGGAYIFQQDHGGQDNWGEVKAIRATLPSPGSQFGGSRCN
jgi:hypothetical protein